MEFDVSETQKAKYHLIRSLQNHVQFSGAKNIQMKTLDNSFFLDKPNTADSGMFLFFQGRVPAWPPDKNVW